AYARAARALADLPRNAALQKARRIAEDAARHRETAERAREAQEPRAALPATRSAAQPPAPRPVPAASAVVPYTASRRHPVPQGSFDFFG
ncbi:hypothetical protein ACPXCX_48150, partial [Streptomyces sp. DT225]